jgi:hypothetical protein
VSPCSRTEARFHESMIGRATPDCLPRTG